MKRREKRRGSAGTTKDAFPVIVLLIFLLASWSLIMSPDLSRSGLDAMVSWGVKSSHPIDQAR